MSTTVNKTPQKETHVEQEKRVEMAHKLEAAKQGRLPDNAELTSGLNKAQAGINKNNDQLSATGKTVTGDINNILETAKTIVNEKNDGNLMQQAYFHSNQAGGKKSFSERINQLRGTSQGSGNKAQVREEAKQNVNSMATIAKLAFLSPEFRETINDIAQISNQLLKSREDKHNGVAADPAARAAPASTTAAPAATTAAPVAATPATTTTTTVRDAPVTGHSAVDAATPNPGLAAAPVVGPVTTGTPDFVVPGTMAPESTRSLDLGGAQAPLQTATTTTTQMPATQMPATTTTTQTPATMDASRAAPGGPRKMTRDEKEDKLISRLVDLAQTLHSNPEYRNSIMYMANSMDKLKASALQRKDQAKATREQDKAREPRAEIEHHKAQAQMNTKQFVENWIGDDYSLDRLLEQIRFLYESSRNDPELRSLLQGWKTWATQTVKDESYVNDKQRVRADTKDLVHRTRAMSQSPQYREQMTVLRREVVYINKAIQRDDTVQTLRNDLNQLGNDLVKDQNGKPVLKPELLRDAQIIIAGVLESIKYIPLPPIHKNDQDMELQLENIVLTATEVAPSNVRFIVQADGEQTGSTQSRQDGNSFIVEVSKIRAHLTSINFFVDKKTGFPKITERGLADIDLMGTNGLSLRIEIAPKVQKTGKDVHNVFEAKNVTCTISKLKIHLRETKHDFLYKLISPIMNMVAKKKIETGVADSIRDGIAKLNNQAAAGATNSAHKADQKAKQSDRVQH